MGDKRLIGFEGRGHLSRRALTLAAFGIFLSPLLGRGVCQAVQLPDLPPDLARTRMSERTIVLSIALAMS